MGIEERFMEDVKVMDIVLIRRHNTFFVGYVAGYGHMGTEKVERFISIFGGRWANDHEVVLSNVKEGNEDRDYRESFRTPDEYVTFLDLRNCDDYRVLKRYEPEKL